MAEVDGIAFLNNALASKPALWVPGVEYFTRTVCRRSPGKFEEPYCYDVRDSRSITTSASARVVNSRVVEVRDLKLGSPIPTSLPEITLLTKKVIRNLADVQVSSTVSLSVTGTESWQVTKTRGLSTTNGGSVSITATIPGIGSGTASANFSQQISISTQQSEGNSRTVSRSSQDTVSVGPYRCVEVELLAYESSAGVPYSATVIIDGDLIDNQSGVSAASHLLTNDERTVQIDGVIQIGAVSESFLSVRDIGKAQVDGMDPEINKEVTETKYVIAGFLNPSFLARFGSSSALKRTDAVVVPMAFALTTKILAIKDDGIGPPNGTHYEVLYTSTVLRPTPACGFGDIGAPNNGVFRVEAREYSTYADGVLLARWQEFVEVFESCWSL